MRHLNKLSLLSLLVSVVALTGCPADEDEKPSNNTNNAPVADMKPVDMPPAQDMAPDLPAVEDVQPDLPPVEDIAPDLPPVEDMAEDMKPVDMGPDPRDLDSDYDRISDYEESLLCTDPNNFDTDGDFINDYQELQLGTDPCDPDTDGDGLNDERELYFGFDPNKTSSYDDGVLDGDRYIVRACDTPASEPVDFYKNNRGDWRLSLPTAFNNYVELTINNAQPKEAAAVYDDPANEVSGFIFSSESTNDALATLLSYKSKVAQVGSIFQDLTEGEFDTHDRFKAAPGEYRITASGKSARAVRDSLLFRLARFNEADASGLPTSAGNTHSKFYVRVAVIKRDDRLITTVAVAPEQLYNTRDQVKFRLSDLTNTTNVSQANDGNELRCHQFPANIEIPEADFYWVLDQSGSMSDDFAKVKSFAQDFYAQLLNTALDFRLGVTNMDEALKGRLRPTVAWHTDPTTFKNEVQTYVIDCTGCSSSAGFAEHGLYVAREGIIYMKNSGTPANLRFRANAQIATIFMTDENDQSVKDGKDPNGPNVGGAVLTSQYENFFAANPLAFSINGTGSGCGEYGVAFEKAALASGGASASLCASDLRASISQILDIVAGRASTFRLPQTPISSTLRVYLGDETDPTQGRWVPRSRQDGFDYFPQSNSIAFFGSYRPQAGSDRGVQVAVHYQNFVDRTKTPPAANGGN